VDEESGISNYRVFRDGSEVATPQDAGFQDTGLAAGTTYSYRISAVNAAGLESELSAAASATTLTDDGPPAPSGLTATPVNATQISLTWTAPEGGAASYRVFRDGAPIGSVTTTAFIDLGLEPATTYRYSVASVDAEGRQGPRSQEVSATTPPPVDLVPPAPPTGLRLVAP
jgi:chitodextrinase